jgi:hypothetical protein
MNPTRLIARAASYLRAFHYGDETRPSRDWLVVMLITAVLLLASAGWSYTLFLRISHSENSAHAVPSALINPASLANIRTLFEKRAAERAHYTSDYHFVDPSK